MNNKLKLIISICLLLLCVVSVILGEIYLDGDFRVLRLVIASIVAATDMFLSLLPCIFTQISISSSQIDPNKYNYKRRQFVDRKLIFKDITTQIESLDAISENIMWIRLYGEDGIGKKTLVSKLFRKYKYPFNRFYFIYDEEIKSICELLNEKYPINNTSFFHEDLYIHTIAKTHRTFVIVESGAKDLSIRATKLLTNWFKVNNCRKKLILISLDKNSEENETNNQSVVFDYKLDRLVKEDSRLLVAKLLKCNCLSTDDIVQASDGNPAAIKSLCNYYLKAKNNFESSNWVEVILRLKNSSKDILLNFCILSIVRGRVSQSTADRITNSQTIEFLTSSGFLVKKTASEFYVPEWLVNTILISNRYNEHISHEVEALMQKNILNDNEKLQIVALVEKEPTDILKVLQYFSENRMFVEINEFYRKLNIIFNLNDFRHKQIIAIIMNALLELGEYGVFNNSFLKINIPIIYELSKIDFRIYLLIANYYHLISQYDKSNQIYYMLQNTKLANSYSLEIDFNIAHNMRHMGELDRANDLFLGIEKEAERNNKFYIRSVTARISIDYFKEHSFQADTAISELESLLTQSETDYNVYRHIANIYRRTENEPDKAITLLNLKIRELERHPLRIIYDYYFELAECYRQLCENNISYYNDAIINYNLALIFAESNHDINLKLCAQFGKALVRYQKDKNKKQLSKSLYLLLDDAKISYVIYYALLTAINILNNDDSIRSRLEDMGFGHYIKVLDSKEIHLLRIMVM